MDLQLGLFPDEQPAPTAAAVGPAHVPPPIRSLAAQLPAGVRLGTSSWSFPGWEGIVFDRRASAARLASGGLAAYARHPLFRTVGLDRTFYRPLPAEDYAAYADGVPSEFRFVVKADRLVTSPVDPSAAGIRERNARFLDARYATEQVVRPCLEGLGGRTGVILFQFPPFPPNLIGGRAAFIERLTRFLARLPQGPTYGVELRTPALLTEDYAHALAENGAVHCYNVHPAMTPLARQLEIVQPYGQATLVVRWMLHAGLGYEAAKDRYAPFDRLVDEDPVSRERIAVAVLDAAIAERDVFVIANNKAEGSAPLTLVRLARTIAQWPGDGDGAGVARAPSATGGTHAS